MWVFCMQRCEEFICQLCEFSVGGGLSNQLAEGKCSFEQRCECSVGKGCECLICRCVSTQYAELWVFSWLRCEFSVGRGLSVQLAEVEVFSWLSWNCSFGTVFSWQRLWVLNLEMCDYSVCRIVNVQLVGTSWSVQFVEVCVFCWQIKVWVFKW